VVVVVVWVPVVDSAGCTAVVPQEAANPTVNAKSAPKDMVDLMERLSAPPDGASGEAGLDPDRMAGPPVGVQREHPKLRH
jgi:hypothetical protein